MLTHAPFRRSGGCSIRKIVCLLYLRALDGIRTRDFHRDRVTRTAVSSTRASGVETPKSFHSSSKCRSQIRTGATGLRARCGTTPLLRGAAASRTAEGEGLEPPRAVTPRLFSKQVPHPAGCLPWVATCFWSSIWRKSGRIRTSTFRVNARTCFHYTTAPMLRQMSLPPEHGSTSEVPTRSPFGPMSHRVGLEPTTTRFKGGCSAN